MISGTKLGICYDTAKWWKHFVEAAESRELDYVLVEMERSDWLDRLKDSELVFWRPNLDPPYCEEAREKLFFLNQQLGKKTVPNWPTFWHYDNKRAQSYFFSHYGVPAPWTFVSYSEEEARSFAEKAEYPFVSKLAEGAASSSVKLIRSKSEALAETRRAFSLSTCSRLLRRWGAEVRLSPRSRSGYVIWQEFIAGNDADLRVTVVGKAHVFAFRRLNRKNDFRASGSGRIAYDVHQVSDAMRYCLNLCRVHDFDVMAFDILYRQERFVIVEMSYTFVDRAVHAAPYHWRMDQKGVLHRVDGHTWPQTILLDYALSHCRD